MKSPTIQYLGCAALVLLFLFFIFRYKLIEGLTDEDGVHWGIAYPPRPYNPPTKFTSCSEINDQTNLTPDQKTDLCNSIILIGTKQKCQWDLTNAKCSAFSS
jgi:hypothetical protein